MELPADLTTLAAEEIIDSAYELREQFFALHDSDDLSDETLDEMAEIVDQLEVLQAEADRRVTLSVRREELAAKVANFSSK